MENDIHAANSSRYYITVRNVAGYNLQLGTDWGRVEPPTGSIASVVNEGSYSGAFAHQPLGQVASDEPASAGDHNLFTKQTHR
jgi:hypothetical protein